jgi:flagellar protein FliJ
MAEQKFTFRLERVRMLRERAEDQAKEELAAQMAERERWAAKLAEAGETLSGARERQLGVAGAGAASAADMLAYQAFLERAEREQQAAELDLSRQDAEVDARRAALQQAAQERQVLERLKEKQETAHRLEAERRESAELDELALSRHRRGRAA